MTLKIKKISFTMVEKAFLIIWTFYSSCFLIFGSELGVEYDIETLNKIATYVTIILQVSMLFLLNRYKLKECFKYIFVLAVAFLIEVNNTDGALLVCVLFIILAQRINIEKLLRYDVFLKICILIVILGLCAIGITENYTTTINGTYKQALGFSHPNVLTVYILVILLEWLCIRYKRMKWYEWLSIIGIAFATMQIGGGRSSVYTFAVIFLLFILAKFIPRIFSLFFTKAAFALITPLMAIVSFWLVSFYNKGNSIAIALNSFMTGRIALSARFLNIYSVQLFGQEVEYISSRVARENNVTSSILDNAYIRCALDWGIIALIVIVIAYSLLFYNLLKKQRIEFALFCLFFVLLGIGETYMLKPIYNLSLLCLLGLRSTEESVAERKRPYPKRTLVFKL